MRFTCVTEEQCFFFHILCCISLYSFIRYADRDVLMCFVKMSKSGDRQAMNHIRIRGNTVWRSRIYFTLVAN